MKEQHKKEIDETSVDNDDSKKVTKTLNSEKGMVNLDDDDSFSSHSFLSSRASGDDANCK